MQKAEIHELKNRQIETLKKMGINSMDELQAALDDLGQFNTMLFTNQVPSLERNKQLAV